VGCRHCIRPSHVYCLRVVAVRCVTSWGLPIVGNMDALLGIDACYLRLVCVRRLCVDCRDATAGLRGIGMWLGEECDMLAAMRAQLACFSPWYGVDQAYPAVARLAFKYCHVQLLLLRCGWAMLCDS
jgi:hypothetical protein